MFVPYNLEIVVVSGRIVVVCGRIVVVCSRIVVGCVGGLGGREGSGGAL